MNDFEITLDTNKLTSTIYSLIRDNCYEEVIAILESIPSSFSKKSGLSLLGYCYYHIKNYEKSAKFYKKLLDDYPNDCNYQLSYAQTLYQIGQYDSAYDLVSKAEDHNMDTDSLNKIKELKISIKYNSEKYSEAKQLIETISDTESDSNCFKKENNLACIFYQEKSYHKALEIYQHVRDQSTKFEAKVTYNIAICYYQLLEFDLALDCLSEIIDFGIKNYPELNIGSDTEGIAIAIASVGNGSILAKAALAEAFNLKAAIYYKLDKMTHATKALTEMPPRAEHELDAVTLHNQGLILNSPNDIETSFEKLSFLLQQDRLLEPTFSNILLMCCKYRKFHYAIDTLERYSQHVYKHLSPTLFEFIETIIVQQTDESKAFDKLEDLLIYHYDHLRKLSKDVPTTKFETYLTDMFIPVLMAQAKILWNRNDYRLIEKLFRKNAEFCSTNFQWKVNFAHVLFVQQKFEEALPFYESIIDQFSEQMLSMNPVILANLCVCYIMTSQNHSASELIKKISNEEDILIAENGTISYHLSIVNLVIGTLYCSKNNYEFGISRIIMSLEPIEKKLAPDTWYYVKRCFLNLLENLAKQLAQLNNNLIRDCLSFLDNCECKRILNIHGAAISTNLFVNINTSKIIDDDNNGDNEIDEEFATIAQDARLIRSQLMQLI